MLLAREKKIVTLLMEHEDKLTTTQIATSLKVSSRTIKTDIKKINEELSDKNEKLENKFKIGDEIEVSFGRTILTVKVLMLKDHVLKDEASSLYEIIKEEKVEEETIY